MKETKRLKAVIIEDQASGVANLRNMLRIACPQVDVIADAPSVVQGIELLQDPEIQPDVAFLDIRLEDGLVFRLLNELEEINFEIIFVTAYHQYLQQACEYSCIGYVNKPIDPDQLKAAVARIRPQRKYWTRKRVQIFESYIHNNPNPFQQMVVQSANRLEFFYIHEIAWLEGSGGYTWFHLKDGRKIMVINTLNHYEELLEPFNFFRIHKSHIININELAFVDKGEDGKVQLKNGTELPIARRRKPEFLKRVLELRMGLFGRVV